MYIKIDAALLAKYLKNTSYIVSKFDKNSALACVYLKTNQDTLVVTLSSEKDKAVITLPCSVIEQGECCVTAHKFINVMQSFVGEVELHVLNNIFTIQQGKIKISLSLIKNSVHNSLFENFKGQYSFVIDGEKLNNMTNTVSPFVDSLEQNVISGINIRVQDNQIKMQTCHNAAMATSTYKCECNNECQINSTLKVETLRAIGNLFVDENITVEADDTTLRFVGERCVLYTKVLNGKFPPIEQLVEKNIICAFELNRLSLEKCLRRVLIVKTSENKRINMNISDNAILITYENTLQELFDNIKQQLNNTQIAVNYEYLLDVLRVLDDSVLKIEITLTRKLKISNKNNIILICSLC